MTDRVVHPMVPASAKRREERWRNAIAAPHPPIEARQKPIGLTIG
jgi:hypothetical protein